MRGCSDRGPGPSAIPDPGPEKPRKFVGVCVVLLVGALLFPAGAWGAGGSDHGLAMGEGPGGAAASSPGCEDHPPIVIVGDEGPLSFTVEDPDTGERVPRPGSGVRGGQGTPEDPFVIGLWCIASASVSQDLALSGIRLERTSAHVVIRENVVDPFVQDPEGREGVAIRLSKAHNVRLEHNVLNAGDVAVVVREGAQVEVVDNQILGEGEKGVVVSGSNDVLVVGNDLQDRRVGVEVSQGLRVRMHSNQVTGSRLAAVAVEGSLDAEVWNNSLGPNPGIALYLSGSQRTFVANNAFVDGGQGVFLWKGVEGSLFRNNTITGNLWEGVVAVSSPVNTFRGNNIFGNDRGVWATDSAGLDLQGNWWGCVEGPGGPGCDEVDAQATPGSWLEDQNVVAGPGHDPPWREPPSGPVPDETHTWSGVVGCSLNYPTAFQPWTCPDPDNDVERTFTIRPGLKTLVVAMEWSPEDACTGAQLRHWLFVPADAVRATKRHQEPSPIEYRVDAGDAMDLPFEQIEEPTQARFRVWGPSHGLHVCHGQPFTVHYHLFYEGHAGPGYSALP